ncbi:uncharacterized protein GLRG_09242 [Colletotrichum graminicola M1.001]|uniref:Tachykinin family protein n=1 Tax=Colletotrichum graminicola (strain M1.001 / M2 / FGSC 10212) TaxID=645133 RepID=E3QTB0_COLGM|nr:uncharacterized protein GLRG_09242 [Colletotrichum graminicola M1.001]EFQ34098.1 hypothetical protein GLRG_09242 [Colletotrichum graminicola M1.001]
MGPEPDYKFITVDAVQGTFQPATRAVRSHAIRTAIHRGESELVASTTLVSQGTIRGKAHLRGRFRLGGTAAKPKDPKNQRRKDAAGPAAPPDIYDLLAQASLPPWIQRLGSDSADPFNTLPIPSNPSVDALVKYFTTRFNLNSTTTDNKRPWFPYAMQSALILRTTLALAAEFLAASMPSPDLTLQREGYLQKGEAMRMLRSRLESRETAKRAGDDLSVLAGVAMLSSAFQGHFAAAEAHLAGLHAMIMARGGPDTIKHDYILCRSINWMSIQVASGLGRVPMLPMFHTLDQVSLPSSVVSRAATPSLRHLDRLAGHDTDEGKEPRQILATLRQAICSQAGAVAADDIRIVMNTADNAILHFLYAERRTATPVQKRFLVLVSAAHVFLYTVLREVPTTGHMARILVARMRAALEDADAIAPVWVSRDDAALLWILFVGVVGSGTAEDRAWFMSRLLEVLERARDVLPPERCSRKNLQQVLARFLWKDKHCLPALNDVWALWERRVT